MTDAEIAMELWDQFLMNPHGANLRAGIIEALSTVRDKKDDWLSFKPIQITYHRQPISDEEIVSIKKATADEYIFNCDQGILPYEDSPFELLELGIEIGFRAAEKHHGILKATGKWRRV